MSKKRYLDNETFTFNKKLRINDSSQEEIVDSISELEKEIAKKMAEISMMFSKLQVYIGEIKKIKIISNQHTEKFGPNYGNNEDEYPVVFNYNNNNDEKWMPYIS